MYPSCTISILRNTFIAIVLVAGIMNAQPDGPRRPVPQRSGVISFEALPVFSPDTSAALINVHYRIRESFFVILRNIESLRTDDFVGKGELLIELWNDKGVAVARHMRNIHIQMQRMPGDDEAPRDLQGAVSFSVPPGTYVVFFNVEDKQSERSFTSKDTRVTSRTAGRGLDVSAPIFSAGPPLENTLTVLNHGTDVFFGERGGLILPVFLPTPSSSVSARYLLTLTTDFRGLEPLEFKLGEALVLDGIPVLVPPPDTLTSAARSVQYRITPSDGHWKTVYLPLPLEKLHPGRAQLKIDLQAGDLMTSTNPTFRVLWPNQPVSLRDQDLAVDALRHIATPDEMDGFKSFSASESIKRFLDFWKKKDPDTATVYNEVMVEYYRRVDAAIRQYSTPDETNGYLSDRGRIYILYGTPATNERVFSPSNPPREVWTYTSVKRKFIFEDRRRNGMYSLIAVENL